MSFITRNQKPLKALEKKFLKTRCISIFEPGFWEAWPSLSETVEYNAFDV